MRNRRKDQGLIFLGLLLMGLLNYPLLGIFNQPELLLGVPMLYAYIFIAWALFVLLLWLFIQRFQRP